jgi:hypothetical protein
MMAPPPTASTGVGRLPRKMSARGRTKRGCMVWTIVERDRFQCWYDRKTRRKLAQGARKDPNRVTTQ